jgi:hypothetical protein
MIEKASTEQVDESKFDSSSPSSLLIELYECEIYKPECVEGQLNFSFVN